MFLDNSFYLMSYSSIGTCKSGQRQSPLLALLNLSKTVMT